jgi:hypothetical protein
MTAEKQINEIDPWLVREISAAASVDPRSVLRELRGEHVRGLSGARVRRVLRERGLPSSTGATLGRAP